MKIIKKIRHIHTHRVDGKVVAQAKVSSGNRRFSSENPHNFTRYTSMIVSGNVDNGPEFEDWIVNMAFKYNEITKPNVFLFDGNFYEMDEYELGQMKDFVSEDEVTDVQEKLIVDIEKDLLVELYNFAYEQAVKTGTVEKLLEIDSRINS